MRERRFSANGIPHYANQLEKQKGLCAICHKLMTTPCQDHDHSCCPPLKSLYDKRAKRRSCGNCLRGILCIPCNGKLGLIERLISLNPQLKLPDDPWFKEARQYIVYWKKIHSETKTR